MGTLLLLALLACGGTTSEAPADAVEEPPQAGKTRKAKAGKGGKARQPVEKTTVQVFFLDTKRYATGEEPYLVPVEREVGAKAPERNAVAEIFQGPTDEEEARGLEAVKSGAEGFTGLKIEDGVARLKLRGGCASEGATVTVYDLIRETLVAFDSVEHVKLSDPEGQTADPEGAGDSRPACLEP